MPTEGFAAEVLAALATAESGRVISLDSGRFPGMPIWSGHPPFQVLTYRTPHGMHVQQDQEWLAPEVNSPNIGIVSELVMATCHSGTHIDSLAHITCGTDDHWFDGVSAQQQLGDFGLLSGGAVDLPPIICRGVLVDVAGYLGVPMLGKGQPITAELMDQVLDATGTSIEPGDVVLFRTGQMSAWPDRTRMADAQGAGVDFSAASELARLGVRAVGTDTESCEVIPSTVPGNPHPVHQHLLIESGVYILENVYLEELATTGVESFLFIALPLKITGATASMLAPVAIL